MCVFCNQRAISGVCSFIPGMARDVIETNLSTIRGRGVTSEIAFFGGSFTGIDRELMISLLDLVDLSAVQEEFHNNLLLSFFILVYPLPENRGSRYCIFSPPNPEGRSPFSGRKLHNDTLFSPTIQII